MISCGQRHPNPVCLTEIFGPASSGRTSPLVSIPAQATDREEACALI
jgi:hypothetical protein